MYLALTIAVGIFVGFWLCVRYVAWVNGAADRANRRAINHDLRLKKEAARMAACQAAEAERVRRRNARREQRRSVG